eukprot:3311593-Rhodomonas_salina.1
MLAGGSRGKQPAQQEEATGADEVEIEYFPNDDEGDYDDGEAGPAAGQVSAPEHKKKQKKAAKKTIVRETQDSGDNAEGFDDSGEDADEIMMPMGNGRDYAWTERLTG